MSKLQRNPGAKDVIPFQKISPQPEDRRPEYFPKAASEEPSRNSASRNASVMDGQHNAKNSNCSRKPVVRPALGPQIPTVSVVGGLTGMPILHALRLQLLTQPASQKRSMHFPTGSDSGWVTKHPQ
jgi:hypothetical protein